MNCNCTTYPFPHRPGGGRCAAPDYVCSECRADDDGKWVDDGSGPYEYGSIVSTHTAWAFVSTCCEAPLLHAGSLIEVENYEVNR